MSIGRRFPLLVLVAALFAALTAMPVLADEGKDSDLVLGTTVVAGVGPSSAQASGELTPSDDHPTDYWFEYGPTTGYGAVTPAVTIEEGDAPIVVSALLHGLSPTTEYHVRLVASSDGQQRKGRHAVFTTRAVPTGDPSDPGGQDPSAPAQGEIVVAAPVDGTVKVRLPGASTFTALADSAPIPVGSSIDARNGTIDLASAHAGGTQTGRFWGSIFVVRQSRTGAGTTALRLRGGSFAGCRSRPAALAQAAGKRKKRVRSLWGKDSGGRFRTHGRDSVATVRGTTWQVIDRCDGTVTRVTEGAVEVRNRHNRKRVLVQAGERHFAPHR
jgi:hypothetical protein